MLVSEKDFPNLIKKDAKTIRTDLFNRVLNRLYLSILY